jgi:hypothetical protein
MFEKVFFSIVAAMDGDVGACIRVFTCMLGYLQHKHTFLERKKNKCMLNSICVSHVKFYVFNRVYIFFQ